MDERALTAAGALPPLLDPASGEPYQADTMPCWHDPASWDSEAPRADRQWARRACRSCPACKPCGERARSLGPLATGVWAGRDRGDPPEGDEPRVYDAAVAAWLAKASVTLRRPRVSRRRRRVLSDG